ncbi:DAK2 domain-containing protein [Nocardia sp. NPDC050718]|uniref:DAK2 domain-containing protein n=1 Tax=Nocardia sp. NPDC050718 TaxID=3155788 RepID=UPI0033D6BA75
MTVSQVREALDGAELLDWARTCRTDLELRRAEIDALNVFPIADSDTGTNLLATMRAAVAAAERAVPDAAGPVRPADRAVPTAADLGISDDSATGGYPDADAGTAPEGGPATDPGDDGGAPVGRGRVSSGAPDVGDRRAGAEVPAHLVAQALARGATTGARGNSGIILSQVLRGIAEAVVGGPLTGERLRTALRRAAVLVRTGLSAPVEGTILTVLDRAAVAAAGSADLSLVSVAQSAAEGAARALNETPAQLGVLRAAGVVDAGARGLLVLLDSLVTQVCGQAPARDSYLRADRSGAAQRRVDDHRPDGERPGDLARSPAVDGRERPANLSDARTTEADSWDDHRDSPDPHFEVMYVISGTDEAAAGGLRDRLAVLGDSVVVVGDGDSTWSAHVHCRDAGAAIEAGLAIGTVTGIRIESFAVTAPHGGHAEHVVADAACDGARADGPRRTGEMVAAQVAGAADAGSAFPHTAGTGAAAPGRPTVDGGSGGPEVNPLADRGILAVASGAAAARLFEDAGAVVLRGDRQLDTTALLTAIRAMPHREVLVLPNGALPAQELVAAGVAARDGSRDVLLLPSASMVQGLAALAVHDRGRIAVDDAFAMSEAAATTRWGALRPARVRALTMVGMCSPGDGLGLVGQDVVVIDPDVVGAGRILLDRMLGLGGELVTLLMGADAGPELGAVLAEHVTAGFPGVEVVVYSGGQQADLVQIGVE